MKTLELNQMDLVEGGIFGLSDCAESAIGLGIGFIGAFFITRPVGAAAFAAGFICGWCWLWPWTCSWMVVRRFGWHGWLRNIWILLKR